jgi:hypothetical protein
VEDEDEEEEEDVVEDSVVAVENRDGFGEFNGMGLVGELGGGIDSISKNGFDTT